MTISQVFGLFYGRMSGFYSQPNSQKAGQNRPKNIEQAEQVLPLLKELPRLKAEGGKGCETTQETRQKERLCRCRSKKAASNGKRDGKADEKATGNIDNPRPPRKQAD